MDRLPDLPSNPRPAASADAPLLIFDGDCKFCRVAVERWREATAGQLRFAPYQEARAKFPHIDERDFKRAVHLVDANGRVSRGAAAVLRAMAHCGRKRWLLNLYEHVPPFAAVAEAWYRFVAANRTPIANMQRIWRGKDLRPPTYHIAVSLFWRLIGLVYFIAFVSLWTQVSGLIGEHGILPAQGYLDAVRDHYAQLGDSPMWRLPTLAWLSASDGFLQFLCGAGTVLSVLVMFGIAPLPALALLWVLYLSMLHVGQTFLSFQWDILLIEVGFVTIFTAPFVWRSRMFADRHAPRLAIVLVWWVLFRLMFESGVVKLTWPAAFAQAGQPQPANTWTALTALDYHYWTQPLPIWTSWYAAKLPEWFQKLSVLFVFVVELVLPWLIFGPRALRYVAGGGIILLMLLIAATGNYNFFNLLTIALAIALLDDRIWPAFLRRRISGTDWPLLASPTRWRTFVLVPFAVVAFLVGGFQVREAVWPQTNPWVTLDTFGLSPLVLVNGYGLFRQMTETRPEIVIEGSNDGSEWKTYEFRWKPGALSQAPRLCAPHQPRLDWQMWFEALRLEQVHQVTGTIDPRHMSPWFQSFIQQLLRGESAVLALLAANPFPDAPPKFLRITLYQYQFTDADGRRATGDWWRREPVWIGPGWSVPKAPALPPALSP